MGSRDEFETAPDNQEGACGCQEGTSSCDSQATDIGDVLHILHVSYVKIGDGLYRKQVTFHVI